VSDTVEVNDANGRGQSTDLQNDAQRQLLTRQNTAAQYQAVYEDLKRLARRQLSRESPFTDLPITMLVHESYARMAKLEMPVNRNAFFGYAA
jgi:ECF sigma factor